MPSGGKRTGAGRKPLGPHLYRATLTVPDALMARLRAADPKGKASAGLRALVEERDCLAAALTRACSDLLSVDRAEGDDTTAPELATSYLEIARTEAWERAQQQPPPQPERDAWTEAQPGRWLVDALRAEAAARGG
jgi:hypothetical protein